MKNIWGFKVYGWMNFFTSDLWMKIVQLDGKLIKSNKKENNQMKFSWMKTFTSILQMKNYLLG